MKGDILKIDKDKKERVGEKRNPEVIEEENGRIRIKLGDWNFKFIKYDGELYLKGDAVIAWEEFSPNWTRLLGKLLAKYPEKEYNPTPIYKSGVWVVEGISPAGSNYYYFLHDQNASSIPLVSNRSKYGLNAVRAFLAEELDEVDPVDFERVLETRQGSKIKFGIKDGKDFWSGGKPWLKSLGIE